VFDVELPVSRQFNRVHDEDTRQVQHFCAQKGALLASGLWNSCWTKIGNPRVALRAQKEKIKLNDAKTCSKQSQRRLERQTKLLQNAQTARIKYKSCGGDNNALKTGVTFLFNGSSLSQGVMPHARPQEKRCNHCETQYN
jgi:hypothetical protein